MKTLIIVRHAAFSHSNPLIADVDRPLNRQGLFQTAEMAHQFAELQMRPDLLVSSVAKRAVETAKAYAKRLDIPLESIRLEDDLFEAERADILRVVHALDDAVETVVLFGHHPGVTKLLHHLVDGGVEKMPMGAFVVLELDAKSWRTVSFKKGMLLRHAAPKEKEAQYGWWWQCTFWYRQRIQKVELFLVFLISLLVILGVVFLIIHFGTDSSVLPA